MSSLDEIEIYEDNFKDDDLADLSSKFLITFKFIFKYGLNTEQRQFLERRFYNDKRHKPDNAESIFISECEVDIIDLNLDLIDIYYFFPLKNLRPDIESFLKCIVIESPLILDTNRNKTHIKLAFNSGFIYDQIQKGALRINFLWSSSNTYFRTRLFEHTVKWIASHFYFNPRIHLNDGKRLLRLQKIIERDKEEIKNIIETNRDSIKCIWLKGPVLHHIDKVEYDDGDILNIDFNNVASCCKVEISSGQDNCKHMLYILILDNDLSLKESSLSHTMCSMVAFMAD